MKISYKKVGDYYIPEMVFPNAKPDKNIGKYGRLRLKYLKHNHMDIYTILLMDDKLNEHLLEIEKEAKEQVKILEQQKLTKKIARRVKKLKQNTYNDKSFIIFPADSVQALIDESTQQNNCVRTYANKYANGECDIYFMRNIKDTNTSLVTVEVRDNKVEQQRSKNNADTTKKQKQFLKNWERKVLSKVAT